MAWPAAKAHPSAFELENSFRFRLHVLRIVNQLLEPFRSIFVNEFTAAPFATIRIIVLLA